MRLRKDFFVVQDENAYPAPEDLKDPNSDTRGDARRGAYEAGRYGRLYLGVWTEEAYDAYLQGLSERRGSGNTKN